MTAQDASLLLLLIFVGLIESSVGKQHRQCTPKSIRTSLLFTRYLGRRMAHIFWEAISYSHT